MLLFGSIAERDREQADFIHKEISMKCLPKGVLALAAIAAGLAVGGGARLKPGSR